MSEDSRTPIDPPADATVDPATIPPADSNEQLKIADDKRAAAAKASGSGPARAKAARERQAAAFAAAGDDQGDDEDAGKDKGADSDAGKGGHSAARSQPPQGRTNRPTTKS